MATPARPSCRGNWGRRIWPSGLERQYPGHGRGQRFFRVHPLLGSGQGGQTPTGLRSWPTSARRASAIPFPCSRPPIGSSAPSRRSRACVHGPASAIPTRNGPSACKAFPCRWTADAHDTDQNLRLAEAFLGKPSRTPAGCLPPGSQSLSPDAAKAGGLLSSAIPVPAPSAAWRRSACRRKSSPTSSPRIRGEFGLTALLIGGPEEVGPAAQHSRPGSGDAACEAPAGSLAGVAGQIAGRTVLPGQRFGSHARGGSPGQALRRLLRPHRRAPHRPLRLEQIPWAGPRAT